MSERNEQRNGTYRDRGPPHFASFEARQAPQAYIMMMHWLTLSLLLVFAALTSSAEFEDDFNIPSGWRMQVPAGNTALSIV